MNELKVQEGLSANELHGWCDKHLCLREVTANRHAVLAYEDF